MIIALALISSALYRIGGAGKEEMPFANSQYRDIGCPVVMFAALAIKFGVCWQVGLSALLVLGFIRTYHDWTGADNMYLHGLGLGLSMVPLYFGGVVSLIEIGAYSAILALVMGSLNNLYTRVRVPYSVWVEELSRGFILVMATGILRGPYGY